MKLKKIIGIISNRIPPIPKKSLSIFICLTLTFSLFGCATNVIPFEPQTDKTKPKSIFVFMDGTANNPDVPTNVFRLFQDINKNNDNQTVAIYIEGVGNADESIAKIVGEILGFGMEEKILRGYKFLVKHYQPGDHIYIFGFSRGAHTARSLAGLVSYAGVSKPSDGNDESPWDYNPFTTGYTFGNKILEMVKEQGDLKKASTWKSWGRGDVPPLKNEIKTQVKTILGGQIDINVQSAEIEFLGVWDTVPGSQLINYFKGDNDLVCKEHEDLADDKQRYQIDSYPAIHHIAHAVSKDEKRSEFRPLFLCSKKINTNSVHNEKLTTLDEKAFPGAHADVGGGYEDKNNQLSEISLNWMISKLNDHYALKSANYKGNSKGLGHLSISVKPLYIFNMECKDRTLPPNINNHESITERNNAGAVPWAYFDKKPKDEAIEKKQNSNKPEDTCINSVDTIDDDKKEKILCIKQSNIACEALGY
jgi:hypothetical protein